MKPLKNVAAKLGRDFYEYGIAANLRLYKKIFMGTAEFCLETVPRTVNRRLEQLEAKGQEYSRGPRAYKRLPLGIVMRDAAEAGLKPFGSIRGELATHAFTFLTGAAAAKIVLLPTMSLLASIVPCALIGLAAFPVLSVATAVAVPCALALGGALLGVPRALCNIGTGRDITREWKAEQEAKKKPRVLKSREVESLPKLERIFYYQLDKIAEAPAHERVQWLEGLKNKFPEDFAKAAVLGPDELGTKLKNEMQVKKKTLQVKKPKRGLAKKIGGVFGRG